MSQSTDATARDTSTTAAVARDTSTAAMLTKICEITLSLIANPTPQDLIRVGQNLHIDGSMIASKVHASDNGGWNELHLAAYDGDIEAIDALKGEDIKEGNKDGWTPMHLAAQKGHIEVMRILLETKKMDPKNCGNNAGFTPLHVAAWNGSIEIINMLNEYGLDNNIESSKGWNALHVAIWNNQLDAVKSLVTKVNLSKGSENEVRPLHIAASLKDTVIAELLLEHEAKLSDRMLCDVKPLHIAVFLGNLEMTTLFITTNKNIPNTKISDKILGDCTPLHIAAFKSHKDIVQYFVEQFPRSEALRALKQDPSPISDSIKAILDTPQAVASAAIDPKKVVYSTSSAAKKDTKSQSNEVKVAEKLITSKHYKTAVKILDILILSYPRDLELHLSKAKACLGLKHFAEARKECTLVLTQGHGDIDLFTKALELLGSTGEE